MNVPLHTVRGIVLLPNGAPAAKAAVSLGEVFTAATTQADDEGHFEFPRVAEGSWNLVADLQAGNLKLRATDALTVPKYDVENLKLQLAPPIALRASIVKEPVDGAAPAAAAVPPMGTLILQIRPTRTTPDAELSPRGTVLLNANARSESDLADAYPGVYRLANIMQPAPPPYYLDSIRIGGADLLTADVPLASDASVTVLYKADGGTVSGRVEDCASGGVLLVPVAPALRRAGISHSGPCDAEGHYEIHAVRPGDFYALAFAGNGPVLQVDDELLKRAIKLTVRSGETTSAAPPTVTKPVF